MRLGVHIFHRTQMLQGRARGIAWALGGILIVTPDACLVRWVRSEGGSVQAVLFMKYLFVCLTMGVFIIVHVGGWQKVIKSIKAGPKHIAVAALAQVGVGVSLNLAFAFTVVARALFGLALSVLWSALISRVVLKEKLPIRTVLAVLSAIACAFVVYLPGFVPSLNSSDSNQTQADQATLHGDFFGVLAGASLGTTVATSRSAKLRAPGCQTLVGVLFGTPLVVVIALAWASAVGVPIVSSTKTALIGALNGVCVGGCYIGTLIAPRYILSAEVGLIGLLELVLGPLWVFAGFGEVPSLFTLVGGGMLIVVLALHEASGCMAASNAKPARTTLGEPQTTPNSKARVLDVGVEVHSTANDGARTNTAD